MLINVSSRPTTHVKFISYTGKFPNKCTGVLTLEIDGEPVIFGQNGEERFWHVTSGEWEIDVSKIPENYRQHADEIDAEFKRNVSWGCCGGCN